MQYEVYEKNKNKRELMRMHIRVPKSGQLLSTLAAADVKKETKEGFMYGLGAQSVYPTTKMLYI